MGVGKRLLWGDTEASGQGGDRAPGGSPLTPLQRLVSPDDRDALGMKAGARSGMVVWKGPDLDALDP